MYAVERRGLDVRDVWLISIVVLALLLMGGAVSGFAQSISSGTINGTVTDQSGAALAGATVEISNAITGYSQRSTSDDTGSFRFNNVPFNSYRIGAKHAGFDVASQAIVIRSTVPATVKLALPVAGVSESVTINAQGVDVLENEPDAHTDVNTSTLSKLPITTPGSGLSEAITMISPGVVNDSNGFFHPQGDHAETSFQIDGQPVNDQLSKVFSTQLPVNALQSMELTTGFPGAEYGEKTSLVVNATTRSGLGLANPTGSFVTNYGSFGTAGEEANLGFGTKKLGFFGAANGSRSGRFLDTPELLPLHDIGNNGSLFNRLDFQPNTNNVFHLDLFVARNWFQIPNTFDQPNQDQRQRVISFNVAPGYQHTFNTHTLLTVNTWLRQDQVSYYPSANPFDDTPATVSQQRRLMSLGGKSDVSYSRGKHNLKLGAQIMQTRLAEHFGLGITDPTFNAICVDATGTPDPKSTPTDPAQCSSVGPGFTTNPNLQPGLIPLDLTRNGSVFRFNSTGNINEYAAYVADTINWGQFTLSPGLRVTRYDGLTGATGVQPRFGLSYLVKRTGSVLRSSYARTLETPQNENLLLSSATGTAGLTQVFGAFGQQPIQSGRRNQFNIGFQQRLGRFLQVDADYFWKYTHNAAEFDVLLNTPITFPIMWRKDKLDGFGIRVSSLDLAGVRVNTTMGHGRLRYFGPEVGGLIFNAPLAKVFRTDSDDAFYQTSTVQYQWRKKGPWAVFTWRYDSGMVAGTGSTLAELLSLTPAQQTDIGFFCGGQVATLQYPITQCSSTNYGANLIRVPALGTADDDRNPPRVAPRNLFDMGIGTDDLLRRGENKQHLTLQFTVSNVTNKVALYNFLSTFGGTHFVQPRSYQAKLGFSF